MVSATENGEVELLSLNFEGTVILNVREHVE